MEEERYYCPECQGYSMFRPVCKLGYRAGLWCHKSDSKHFCNKYQVKENEK